jgi:thiamine transport system substrate-binding protein
VRTTAILLIFFSTSVIAQDKPVLTVYTYDSFISEWGPGPGIETAFELECGCDLQFVAVDSSTGILSRVQLEGSNSPADIVLGLDNSLMTEAENTGLLKPHGMQLGAMDLPIEWNSDIFIPFDFGYFAFIYDSTKMASPPASFEGLIDADSSLRIVIQDPRSSTPGLGLVLWIKALYGDEAGQVWQKLDPKILTVTKGWWESYSMFLEGEADMVLSYTTSPAYHMITEQESKYRAAGFDTGHGMQIEVAAILKSTINPELAARFLEFVHSPQFQSIIPTTNWMFPVVSPADGLPLEFRDLVAPSKGLTIDSEAIAANKSAWIDEFSQALSQ